MTLSSILIWFSFFDVGLGNGMRNYLAQAIAEKNYKKGQIYLTTTFFMLTVIAVVLSILVIILAFTLDLTKVFNTITLDNFQLREAVIIASICTLVVFVVKNIGVVYVALQHYAINDLLIVSGNIIALLLIFLCTKANSTGNLSNVVLIFTATPAVIFLLGSIPLFRKHKELRPTFNSFDWTLGKQLLEKGLGFFFIQITSCLVIFGGSNIFITQFIGPEAVTTYNIAYKYFNVLLMFAMIILQPFWSSFTDAYTKKDFQWMKQVLKKLELFGLLSIPVIIIMILCSDFAYDIWLGGAVKVDIMMTISVAFYFFCCIIANVYMVLINGTGKVFIQMIIYGIFAVLAFPLMYLLCETYNSSVMMLIPSLVYIVQAISGKIQLTKIIQNTDTGLWAK